MNQLETRALEERKAITEDYIWPSATDALQLLFLRWKTFAASVIVALGLTLLVLRVIPKTYESVAVVTTRGAEIKNPAERDKDTFKVLDREKLALDELRSSLFSYNIIKKAADESGITLIDKISGIDHFKRSLWSLVGGEISTDVVAQERVAMDVLRFKHFTFEKLDARSVQDRLVERDTNMFLVGMQYNDPKIARLFLQRVLELYREKLATDQAASNEKLAKIYEELASSFGKNIESMQGSPKVARQKLQTMDMLKEQLKAKLNDETLTRNNAEQEISALRKDVMDAEARYSDKHPLVDSLRKKLVEGSIRARAPLTRIQGEISALRTQLNSSFSDLLGVSQGTFENSGGATEGHSEQFTKDRRELRSMSNVFETMKERYLQIIVQERISNMASSSALEIVEPASLPLRPQSPSMTKILLLGLVVGIGFGLFVVFTSEVFYPIVRNRWVLSLRTKLPVFGEQQLPIAESIAQLDGLDINPATRNQLSFKRRLRRVASRVKTTKTRVKNKELESTGLEFLLTKLGSIPRSQHRIFQCGLMPLAHETSSVAVTYALAKQLAAASPGRLKVVVVATQRHGGILEVLEEKPASQSERLLITESGVAIFDACDMPLNAQLAVDLAAKGFDSIIWDLPAHHVLAWKSLDLPNMPLVGVLEYGQARYTEIADATAWLRIMSTENHFTTGLFVAGSVNLPRVKLFEYLLDKVA